MEAAAPTLVIGTAGHIDHGKSRLVLALTGTNPDRLPEEQARGMTIDLGFAHAAVEDCTLWFVDVPGHERFIRNMLAGATGIDLALLVVAADDSVMPQTREHAEVLSLLGVARCIIVLTKLDLVDDEWAAQVEEEARALLTKLNITPVACVHTSSQTGRGLDELRRLLVQLARQRAQDTGPHAWFRLPIDRAFSVPGRGTVVTGSVAHGAVQREDELELWPAGTRVRVRDLQAHHDERQSAAGRMRLAVNLAGVAPEQVQRGCTLASVGYLQPARYLDVWLPWLRMPGKTVRQTLRLRLHLATSEVLAELRLLDKPAEPTVRGQFAQLKVAEPIVAIWGQRFILRDESGSRTLGGGTILRPAARLWTSKRPAQRDGLQNLLDAAPAARLEEVIRAAEWQPLDDRRLSVLAGLRDAADVGAEAKRLMGAGKIRILEAASTRVYVHNAHLDKLGQDLVRRLKQYMTDNPRLPGLPQSQWVGWMPGACPQRLRPVLADWFIERGRAVVTNGHIVPAGEQQTMAPADQALLTAILAEFAAGAYQPPALEALQCRTPRNAQRVRELVELAAKRGQLMRIADGIWLHADRWTELVARLAETVRTRGPVTVADIRTMCNSSRKFIVPLVERLDALGITRRQGDLRTLGPKAPE